MAPIKKRSRLKATTFAIRPSKGSPGKYPMPDRSHARNALARVSQYGTPKEKRAVARAVKRKFPALGKRSQKVRQWLK